MANDTNVDASPEQSPVTHRQLLHAIDRHGLALHYQPLIDLGSGLIRGFEALVRLSHPDIGFIAAAEFIPLAEDVGLIRAIDDWVVLTACDQLAAWQRAGTVGDHFDLAVNVSGSELDDGTLGKRFERALAISGADPASLIVEITESQWCGQKASARSMAMLNDLGVRVALDDFGAGHATFSRLRSLNFDFLKIDQSITSLITHSVGQGFVRMVVEECNGHGVSVIAEGIETAEQASAAAKLNCQLGQGFFWSPALSSAEAQWLLLSTTPPTSCAAKHARVSTPATTTPRTKTKAPISVAAKSERGH